MKRNYAIKVTTSKVRDIRRKAGKGYTTRQLMEEYGLGQTTVRDIVLYKSWKQVAA